MTCNVCWQQKSSSYCASHQISPGARFQAFCVPWGPEILKFIKENLQRSLLESLNSTVPVHPICYLNSCFLQFHSKSPGAVWTGRWCWALSHRDTWPLWSAVVFANTVFVPLFPTTFETVSWKVHKLLCLYRLVYHHNLYCSDGSQPVMGVSTSTYIPYPPPPPSINHMKFMSMLSIIGASFSHLFDACHPFSPWIFSSLLP